MSGSFWLWAGGRPPRELDLPGQGGRSPSPPRCSKFKQAINVFKRLENYSRSPVFSHILTALRGLSSIHVYGKTEDFVHQ